MPQALRAAEEQELQRVAWEEVEAARLVEERRREEERQRLEAERLEVEQKEFEANFGRIMEICQTFIGKQATATAQLLSNARLANTELEKSLRINTARSCTRTRR